MLVASCGDMAETLLWGKQGAGASRFVETMLTASDQRWADTCHFDFASRFDATGASGLPVQP
jgi:hypothetical protein